MTADDKVFAKCAWRLIPFMGLLYLINYVDRTNVGFAALTMNADLSFSPAVFGLGAGIFFFGYALFQVPANLILERLGARRWVFCILLTWGVLSASTALVQTPTSFYLVRFFLGIAEAGFFPGMLLYLTYWFPRTELPRITAAFMVAIPLSFVVGGLLAGVILELDGVAGLRGWQWLFVIEGLPASLLAFAALKLLPDGPAHADWLSDEEKQIVAARVGAEEPASKGDLLSALTDARVITLGLANFTSQAGAYGVALFLPQIIQAMGFSNRGTSFVMALIFTIGAVAMILCGRSSSMRNERIWHVALPWLIAAAGVAMAFVVQFDLVVIIGLAVGAIGINAALGPFFSLPSTFLRGTAAAGGIGLFNTLGNLGAFFGPTLVGALMQGRGNYASGLIAAAVALAVAALIVVALGRVVAAGPLTTKQAA
jgi:ACS family tartrate transporter-like MFS transporter